MASAKNAIFRDFAEYYHFTRCMTQSQKDVLFKSLPSDQRRRLKKSCKEGGWIDLIFRNYIDDILDQIKASMGIDLLEMRCKARSGKTVYLKKSQWDGVLSLLSPYSQEHVAYVLSGLKAVPEDEQTVLLTSDRE